MRKARSLGLSEYLYINNIENRQIGNIKNNILLY